MKARITDDKKLVVSYDDPMRNDWMECLCATCGDPIRWVLDVWSFVRDPDGSFSAVHGECAWTEEVVTRRRPISASYVV